MNCPEHLILETKYLTIWHIQRADIRREHVTWREVLNPLRYELIIGRWRWNNEAWLNRKWSNFNWWLWKRKYREVFGWPSNKKH